MPRDERQLLLLLDVRCVKFRLPILPGEGTVFRCPLLGRVSYSCSFRLEVIVVKQREHSSSL